MCNLKPEMDPQAQAGEARFQCRAWRPQVAKLPVRTIWHVVAVLGHLLLPSGCGRHRTVRNPHEFLAKAARDVKATLCGCQRAPFPSKNYSRTWGRLQISSPYNASYSQKLEYTVKPHPLTPPKKNCTCTQG